MFEKLKESINDRLEKMAKSNEEVMGPGRPDCCTLNRQENIKQQNQKGRK
ncbi:MAG: hypothetical protein IJV66_00815 [Firmicutes bacterium]|nr:hypothetical protein [Bacillota bacterium]